MKILVEGREYLQLEYRVECKHCHCIFEGTINEICHPFDPHSTDKSLDEVRCPSCRVIDSYLATDPATNNFVLDTKYIRPLYPVLADFDNKKIGLQKKENI